MTKTIWSGCDGIILRKITFEDGVCKQNVVIILHCNWMDMSQHFIQWILWTVCFFSNSARLSSSLSINCRVFAILSTLFDKMLIVKKSNPTQKIKPVPKIIMILRWTTISCATSITLCLTQYKTTPSITTNSIAEGIPSFKIIFDRKLLFNLTQSPHLFWYWLKGAVQSL